jgi:hypothetical protein
MAARFQEEFNDELAGGGAAGDAPDLIPYGFLRTDIVGVQHYNGQVRLLGIHCLVFPFFFLVFLLATALM